MITTTLLTTGLALGARPLPLALVGAAVFFPVPAVGLVLVLMWVLRTRPSTRAAVFCEAVAAELRAGTSLRLAISQSAQQVGSDDVARLCEAGAPLDSVAAAVRSSFEEVGPELEALVVRGVEFGAPSAALFEEVGDIALAQTAVARETAAATAPVRATAVVMFGALVLGLVRVVGDGGLARLAGSSAQLGAMVVGLVLVMAGTGVALMILTRGL